MRIALFTETYPPQVNGVATHVKNLRDGLIALGHKVLVVTADASLRRHVFRDGVLYCPSARLNIYELSLAPPLSPKRLEYIKRFKPDIIHIHNEFGLGISGVFIARIINVPVAYTLHTMYENYIYYIAGAAAGSVITAAALKYAKALEQTTTVLIGPSPKVADYFRRSGVKKHVNIVPNPVELDLFDKTAAQQSRIAQIREQYGYTEHDRVFCFCGRLGIEKNITLLLSYWVSVVKEGRIKTQAGTNGSAGTFRLLIIGGGPHQEQLEREIDGFDIRDSVAITGEIPHEDVPLYLGAGVGYITASLSDTYSISMLEAMAMGLPVLHIKDELNAGQVEHGVNWYIYSNASEMKTYAELVANMTDTERALLSDRVRASVLSRGAVQMAKRVTAIYERAVRAYKRKRIIRKKNDPFENFIARLNTDLN